MTVLAIDTSAEQGSLALLTSDGRLTEAVLHAPDGHSSRLFVEIQSLLQRAGMTLVEVDCFAAAAGPGSFTGVRVALSAAKGFALALGKPMAAVSNLQALAWFGSGPHRAVAMDARRGDFFTATYDDALETVEAETLVSALAPGVAYLTPQPEHVLARAIAAITQKRGTLVDPALTDANYVRHSDAELKWTDR